MRVYLPANLDIDTHIVKYPPTRISSFQKDKLVYLLSLLLSIPANNKSLSKNVGPWIPLHSKLLQKKIGNDYSLYKKYALGEFDPGKQDAKIIKTDNKYITGKKATGFSFVTRYSSHSQIKEVDITYQVLLRKLRKDRHVNIQLVSTLYPNLVKWFNPSRLKIDACRAREYAEQLVQWEQKKSYNIIIKRLNSTSSGSFKEYEEIDELPDHIKQSINYLTNINRIEEGDFFLTVDKNVRRFHSNLTNLKSELRHFLTFDNKQLVSIDIANAQPFLSLALFKKEFLDDPASRNKLDTTFNFNEFTPATYEEDEDVIVEPINLSEEDIENNEAETYTSTSRRNPNGFHLINIAPILYEDLKKENKLNQSIQSIIPLYTSLIMFTENMNNHANSDLIQFKESVVRGSFYEDFLVALEREGITGISSRSEAKGAMFLVLFTDNRFFNSEAAAPKRMFSRIYPTVYEYFNLIKYRDPSRLSRLLQSIESWLILDQICERISKEKPDAPIYTIHDSVVTTLEYEDYVKNLMEDVIKQFIGYAPVLKPTVYNPDDLPATYEEYLLS